MKNEFRPNHTLSIVFALLLPVTCVAQELKTYAGPCDASAAVAVDAESFVVGTDENDTLLVYRRDQAAPIASLPLAKYLSSDDKEADLEGATIIGSRIYWITSHSRNSASKIRPSRHRIFATEVRPGNILKPVGTPYIHLLRDLEESAALKPYKLAAASRMAAEAEGGLNIEGLAATPDGKLLIGFRNPLHGQHALIVPLENPSEVIDGQRAKLGAPMELDLGGRGIRSMERVGTSYFIVAGPTADIGSFALYHWSGKSAEAASMVSGVSLMDLRPEAMFPIPQSERVQLLSDDGGIQVDGVECKDLALAKQIFRSLIVTPY